MSKPSRRRSAKQRQSTAPARQNAGAVDLSTSHSSLVVSHRSGPLPAPEELAAYNNVVVDGAERIFQQFEEQSEHRRELESRVIRSDIARSWAGLVAGLVLDLLLIGMTWDLVRTGHEYGGKLIGVTLLVNVGIIGVSYKAQRERRARRDDRREALERRRGH